MRLDAEDSIRGQWIADEILRTTVKNGAVNWDHFGSAIQSVLEAADPSPSALAQAGWHVAAVYPHPEWSMRVRQALDAALQVSLVKAQIDANAALAEASTNMEITSQKLARDSLRLAVVSVVLAILGLIAGLIAPYLAR